jgi:hypothetical protein
MEPTEGPTKSPSEIAINATPPTNPNPKIDKLTLELLTNRSHYKKYLSKEQPEKYEKKQSHLSKIHKYASKIKSLMLDLLLDPEMPVTNDVNGSFNQFLNVCVRHFEMREIEDRGAGYKAEIDDAEFEDDEDTLFGSMDEPDEPPISRFEDPFTKSLWGTGAVKLRKK